MMNSSQQPPVPGRGRGDPSHIAPFLTPLVTEPAYVSPHNAGRPRKSAKSKFQGRPREDRRRDADEPRFNIAAPVSPRTHRKPLQRTPRTPPVMQTMVPYSRDTLIPDYPPPSFQEAISESSPPPFNVVPAVHIHRETPTTPATSARPSPAAHAALLPVLPLPAATSPGSTLASLPDTLSLQSPDPSHISTTHSSSSHQPSAPSEFSDNSSETSSIEVVDLNQSQDESDRRLGLSQDWKADRRLGLPLKLRVQRDYRRRHAGESVTPPPVLPHQHISEDSAPQGASQYLADRCTHCGRTNAIDCDIGQFSPRHSPDFTDLDGSPPTSPRSGRFMWRKLFAPMVPNDLKAGPSSPMMSPHSPLAGLSTPWASSLTLTLGSSTPPSKSSSPASIAKRKDSFSVRRLFGSKGKERDSSPDNDVADNWELLDQSSVPSDSSLSLGSAQGEAVVHEGEARPAGKLHGDALPHVKMPAPVAFLKRPLRQGPQPISRPMFLGSAVDISVPSGASLQGAPQVPRTANNSDAGREKSKQPLRPSTPLPLAQRVVTSSSSVSLPGTERKATLGLIDTRRMDQATLPPLPRHRAHSEGRHVVPTAKDEVQSSMTSQPTQGIPTDSPHLRQRSNTGSPALGNLTLAQGKASPAVVCDGPDDTTPWHDRILLASEIGPHASGTKVPDTSRPSVIPSSPRSPSSPLSDSPPRTPTTPTHHYPGRPLPHPPLQPSPRTVSPAIVASPELLDYPQYADLDVFGSRVVDDEHKARVYEDRVPESPHVRMAEPSFIDFPGNRLSTVGRVELQNRRDNRVKVKLILMGREVDKCCICLSQFRNDELAALGTNCDHAFHEYCLKCWLVKNNACPLCCKPVN